MKDDEIERRIEQLKLRAGMFSIERTGGKAKVGDWTSCDEGFSTSIFDGIVGGGLLQ